MAEGDRFEKYAAGARQTFVNWENLVQEINDSYGRHRGLVHGVQKDAIQNSWDAKATRKGSGWKTTFSLVEGSRSTYLVIQDEGTTGLTGRILEREEDFLKDLPPEEKWGRFESLAFTKGTGEEALGSRGRGKFIFVAAATGRRIVYDSLRNDRTYRAGMRYVKLTQSPVNAWDGDEGQAAFSDMTEGRLPLLESTGTRVVIVDPVDELVEAIRSGMFARHIGETWWEIIEKYGARIDVHWDGKTTQVKVPKEFRLPESDTADTKVRVRKLKVVEGAWKVKKLHLVHRDPDQVPEDIRGVAIQRGGMKVAAVQAEDLPPDIRNGIFGYITVAEDVEAELRGAEDPEHYSFDYRNPAARALRNYIRQEAAQFAHEKLGWSEHPLAKKARRQRNAEQKALNIFNRLTRNLDFTDKPAGPGTSGASGSGGGAGPGDGGGPHQGVWVEMPPLMLPTTRSRRVNYGESVGNIAATAHNAGSTTADFKLKVFLRREDSEKRVYHNIDYALDPGEVTPDIGPFEQDFQGTGDLEPGRYTLVARAVSLMPGSKGEILSERRQTFYVEMEPPAGGGIFEKCDAVEFPPKYVHKMAEAKVGEEGGYILRYNIMHPKWRQVEDDENSQAEYLFNLMVMEFSRLDLERGEPVLFKEVNLEDPARVASAVFDVLGRFVHDYFAGR